MPGKPTRIGRLIRTHRTSEAREELLALASKLDDADRSLAGLGRTQGVSRSTTWRWVKSLGIAQQVDDVLYPPPR